MGADDYLPKPFEPKELILRIKSILKRTQIRERKRVISFSKIKIDLNKLFIFKDNEQYKINNTEKIILDKMINAPGKIFLRKKIEDDPKNPKFLQTIRGEGYVLWIE